MARAPPGGWISGVEIPGHRLERIDGTGLGFAGGRGRRGTPLLGFAQGRRSHPRRVDRHGGSLHALIELGLADLLGEGLLHRFGHAVGELHLCDLGVDPRQPGAHLLEPGFHRGHLRHHLLLTGAVGSAGEGVADGVGAAHELDIAQALGGVVVEEEGVVLLVGIGLGSTAGDLGTGGAALAPEAIEQTHRKCSVWVSKP